MCSGTKRKPSAMEGGESEKQEGLRYNFSVLLELSASDDRAAFRAAVEEQGHGCIDEASLWYGRRIGSKKMAFEERTPLMIAAMFGSKAIVDYILGTGLADVNRACGSDRATALHCAAAGASAASAEVVELLLAASADADSLDASGNRPGDLIAPQFNPRKKALLVMLNGASSDDEVCSLPEQVIEEFESPTAIRSSNSPPEKREFPVDLSLPDIKNGIYSTDDFRMYTFKIKPCSRAYSHDWTECPFVHPGENARRRDPRKYHYSCVPCPEFRKGTCRQGDACEYAHGIFECWLHPAQYRTRLCKDETGCQRRVCFFAHKQEELRPLYASTGSAVPSPRSFSAAAGVDMGAISPLALCSPPMTPTGASSPMSVNMWQNPPTLQLPGSRLKAALSARDMDMDVELLSGIESFRLRQQLMDEISSGISSPSGWNNGLSSAGEMGRIGGVKPTNLEDIFGSQLQGFSLDAAAASQLQSPKGIQMRQSMNQPQQLNSSYPIGLQSSPARASSLFGGVETSGGSSAASVLSSRAAAFAKRSQSFIERSAVNRHSVFSSPAGSSVVPSSNLSDWGSPDGKLDWGMQGEELSKLRKSASFGLRSSGGGSIGNYAAATAVASMPADEPDVSWVQSLVIDPQPVKTVQFNNSFEEQQQCHFDAGASPEMLPAWVEQMYMEQEQMVA